MKAKKMPLFIINQIADFKQQTMSKQNKFHNILIAIYVVNNFPLKIYASLVTN